MFEPARIIDANANRAREGLRVLEELARFHLNDAALSETIKRLRHELGIALGSLPLSAADRLAARNTPEDVGTSISTEAEHSRPTLDALAAAAAARTSEALRVLEEVVKFLPAPAGAFESLRYRLYDAERTLRLRLHTRLPQWKLCVLVTESLCRLPWQDVVLAAIDAGADCIQLREKSMPGGELLARARALIRLVDARAHVVINDRPDVALLSGADAVHIGTGDLPLQDVQRLVRGRIAIGCSASSLDRARALAGQGVDYLGLGAMFETTTKQSPQTVGPDLVRQVLACPETAGIPHVAIGGVTPHNAGSVVEAGARGLAVSSAVCCDPEPARICRALLAYVNQTSPAGRGCTSPNVGPTPHGGSTT